MVWKKIPNWERLFMQRKKILFVSVDVDDF